MSKPHKNKVALITGGGSDIGRACALEFAEMGSRTVVVDDSRSDGIKTVELIEEIGGEGAFFKCDVGQTKQVKELIHKIVESYERLDYACNYAGIVTAKSLTSDHQGDAWNNVVYTDLNRIWLCMKYEVPVMIKQEAGIIVNVASKHGVLGHTKNAALEHSTQGIRINSVCPGFVYSPNLERERVDRDLGFYHPHAGLHPVEDLNRPEEIANSVVGLCSNENSFISHSTQAFTGI
jgi:NAD(P)-dependent dehydrogenase (short-subunit alcohol dehydrogenase family)